MSRKLAVIGLLISVFLIGFVVFARQAGAKVDPAQKRVDIGGTSKRALKVAAPFQSEMTTTDRGTVDTDDPTAETAGSTEEDADIPPFMWGKINKEEYLERRENYINRLRGIDKQKRFDPTARGRAIDEMNRQEGRTATSSSTDDTAGRWTVDKLFPNLPISDVLWKPIGPAPLDNGQTFSISHAVSGRTIAIAIHPTNPDIAYAGTAQGGLYRTLDGGGTWTALMDNAQSLAIGAIAISPSQPSTIYVGTGEGNFSADSFFGVGVYRIDNADTASPTVNGPFNQNAALADVLSGWSIDKIIVHPTDPNTIFVAVASGAGGISGTSLNDTGPASTKPRGLFRSTNAAGGSPTFTKLVVATDSGGNLSSTDIEFEPGNPNTVLTTVRGTSVAGSGGVYRSTNALDAVPVFTRTLATISASTLNRTEIAINKIGAVVTVYAATADASGTVKRSIDGGVTWSAALANATGYCGGQCNYDMPIAVDPNNADIVYLGGPGDGAPAHIFSKSTNATAATPTFGTAQNGLHADEHAIEVDPNFPNIVWTGSDGGIWKSNDRAANWTSLNNKGFNATQFQSLALHPTDPYFTIGGTQDNGTEWQKPNNSWTRADFGDGGFTAIDQNATDTTNVTMYHTYFNLVGTGGLVAFARVTNTANAQDNGWAVGSFVLTDTAVSFYAPIALGPGNPNTFYFASDRLRRSANSGGTFVTVSQAPITSGVPITAVGISPQSDNVRVVGLSNGHVWRTTTGSSTLNDVTGTIPARYVSRAVVDPTNVDTAYVTLSGYFGNATPHIYKTVNLSNAAPTWTGIGGTIPDVPINAFVVDPSNSNDLFAGTDIGVYRSTDGGANWSPFSNGLPRVAVFDMAIQNTARILRIATHGRGMWEISLIANTIPATLQGVVRDAVNNVPINGASVTAGNYTTTTNSSGSYQIANLDPGVTTVSASANGFATALQTISLNYGSTTTQDISLSRVSTGTCVADTSQVDFESGVRNNLDTTTSSGDVSLARVFAVDQKNESVTTSGFGFNSTAWFGQTFTAAVTGPMPKVDVDLFCSGCTGTTPNITVSLRAASGDLPTGPDLATGTITGFSSGSGGYFTANFSSVPTVTAGTSYALVVRAVSNPSAGTYAYVVSTGSPYAGGRRVTSGDSGSTWAGQTTDVGFHTYIDTGYSVPGDLVSRVIDSNPAPGATPTWTTLSWTATTPAGTNVQFQVAGHNNPSGAFNFVGPDGTASTFFTTNGASLSMFNGNRYLKYKAYLSTSNPSVTPTLSDVSICFADQPSVTILTALSATGTYGGTANLSAILTTSGNPVSGKSVSFTLNGGAAGSALTNASGVATVANASLVGINAGSYPSGVVASFAGDGGYAASNGSNTLTVNKGSTTTSVVSSVNPSVFGQGVTFTASVAPVAPATGVPTGSVTFTVDGAGQAPMALSGGSATLTTSSLNVSGSPHTVAVVYSSDTNFNASSGSLAGGQTVNKASTSTTVSSTVNPSVYGQPVTFNATVSAVAPGAGIPTGTVTFTIDGNPACSSVSLNGSAQAGCTISSLTVAGSPHSVAVTYSGDSNFNTSTGSLAGGQTVNKANTTSTVGSSLNPSVYGQTVAFTVTVSAVAPGAGTPTGTVTFLIDGNPACISALAGGQASCTPSTLSAGMHAVTATYNGDANFNTSTGSLTQTVNKAGTTTTITNAAALATPTGVGQSYPVTWSVTVVGPGSGTPTGTVTVSDGSATCTAVVSAGSCNVISNTPGVKTITATYNGDANFNASTSPPVSHTVGVFINGNVKRYVPGGPNTNLAGVTITLSGSASATAATDVNGNYSFLLLISGGSYTLTPSSGSKVFEPVTRSLSNVVAPVSNADFIAYDSQGAVPRAINVVTSYVTPGQPVTVPIDLTSLGNETFVQFSLPYDFNRLGSPTAVCGSSASGCTVTMTNPSQGVLGITVTPTAAFNAGLREIVKVTFQTFATNQPNTPLNFNDSPTVKLLKNAANDPLPSNYVNGFVVFAQGLEGDVAPQKTGDGQLLSNDVTLVRQMVVGAVIPDPTFNEFQRADSAPRSSNGDGQVDAADTVQIRRYVAGLDPSNAANGPGGPPQPVLTANFETEVPNTMIAAAGRTMRMVPTIASVGGKAVVSIELDGQGDEIASSFTLNYDQTKLRNPLVELGSGVSSSAFLTTNARKSGKIAVLVDSNDPFPGKQLVTVTFDVTAKAGGGDSTISFTNAITARAISDASGNSLPTDYVDGTVTIYGANSQSMEVSGVIATPEGDGMRNATVTLTDSKGNVQESVTNSFGYYRFETVVAGEIYTIAVASKQYQFEPRVVQVSDNMAEVNMRPLE